MSTFEPVLLRCPACGHGEKHQVAVSINAARRPALRDEIEAGAFHAYTCGACNRPYRHETTFTYLALERRQLMLVLPPASAPRWRDAEVALAGIAERTLTGAEVPSAARALAEGLAQRVCFGLAAFREKVLCAAWRIDDIALELAKLALLAADPLRHAPGVALRLDARTDDALLLRPEAPANGNGEQVVLARAMLAALDDAAYAGARAALSPAGDGPARFVDVRRLFDP